MKWIYSFRIENINLINYLQVRIKYTIATILTIICKKTSKSKCKACNFFLITLITNVPTYIIMSSTFVQYTIWLRRQAVFRCKVLQLPLYSIINVIYIYILYIGIGT